MVCVATVLISGVQHTDQWRETTPQRQNCVVHIQSVRFEALQSTGTNKCTHCKDQGKGKGHPRTGHEGS